jgi:serine/threonine-protein kinase HipA
LGLKFAIIGTLNPVSSGNGLKLNISKEDNTQSLDLCLKAAPYFRLNKVKTQEVMQQVITAVRSWKKVAGDHLSKSEIEQMRTAFRV